MIIVGKPFVWDGGSCLTAESVPWGVLIAELGWAEGFSMIVLAEPIACGVYSPRFCW